MQTQSGSANVTNGSSTVTSSVGNDWSQVLTGSLFGVDDVWYTVTSNATSTGSGATIVYTITLGAFYAGVTATGVAYAIHIDFEPLYGFPILSAGDTQVATLLNRFIKAVADRFGGGSGYLLGNCPLNGTVPLSATRYISTGGTLGTTEGNFTQVAAIGGTIRKLYVQTSTAQPATGSLTFTLRVNGVDSTVVCTLAANATAGIYSNAAGSVALAAGANWSLKIVNAATTVSANIISMSASM